MRRQRPGCDATAPTAEDLHIRARPSADLSTISWQPRQASGLPC